MSATPYPISGKVYDSDSVIIKSVAVSVLNTDTNEELTTTTNSSGEYAVDLANLTSGYRNGDLISVYSSYGRKYLEQFHTIDTSAGQSTQNLTLSLTVTTSAVYCSVTDIRDFTNVSSGEFSDTQLYLMSKMATSMIDNETGRTWKGIQTITAELYDGDDTDTLSLDQTDVQSVTKVEIDQSGEGTYTTVTSTNAMTSSGCFVYNAYIILDKYANVTKFKSGTHTTKVTYTHGFSKPTEEIKLLAIYIVANMLKRNESYREVIESELKKNRRKVRLS